MGVLRKFEMSEALELRQKEIAEREEAVYGRRKMDGIGKTN